LRGDAVFVRSDELSTDVVRSDEFCSNQQYSDEFGTNLWAHFGSDVRSDQRPHFGSDAHTADEVAQTTP
jgi:hypothetical protein